MKLKKINIKIPRIEIYGIDIIKSFFFLVLVLIIFIFFLAILIAPAVKELKLTKKTYQTNLTIFNNKQDTRDNLKFKLKNEKYKNKIILQKLQNNFVPKNFKSKKIKITSIKKLSTKTKYPFLYTTYKVNAIIKTPFDFYSFVDNLSQYPYILKIEFPIFFEGKNNQIYISFNLSHIKVINEKNINYR